MTLFAPDVPPGFLYRDDFISVEEERRLAAEIGELAFAAFEMRGVVARRRVKFFGRSYEAAGAEEPIPPFLLSLRDRLAAWAGVEASAFSMALINEYKEAAPIGWHRDAPQYDIVAGVSLLSPARMKLRPYVPPKDMARVSSPRRATHEVDLRPRSAYLITGDARQNYEHSIPPVASLRYSITFRTLR